MSAPPSCFGSSWSPNAVECKGGLDPGYINPSDQSHRRDQCSWYTACASRTCANQVGTRPQQQQQVIAPQSMIRTQSSTGQPVPIMRPVPPAMQQFQQPYPQYQPQPGMVTMMMAPPHQAYYGPSMVPVNHPQPGAEILSYLAVPEPVDLSVPWYKRLFHEIFRAVTKASCHQAASFVDHTPMSVPRTPQ